MAIRSSKEKGELLRAIQDAVEWAIQFTDDIDYSEISELFEKLNNIYANKGIPVRYFYWEDNDWNGTYEVRLHLKLPICIHRDYIIIAWEYRYEDTRSNIWEESYEVIADYFYKELILALGIQEDFNVMVKAQNFVAVP